MSKELQPLGVFTLNSAVKRIIKGKFTKKYYKLKYRLTLRLEYIIILM